MLATSFASQPDPFRQTNGLELRRRLVARDLQDDGVAGVEVISEAWCHSDTGGLTPGASFRRVGRRGACVSLRKAWSKFQTCPNKSDMPDAGGVLMLTCHGNAKHALQLPACREGGRGVGVETSPEALGS